MKKLVLILTVVTFILGACGQHSEPKASELKNETQVKDEQKLVKGDVKAMIKPFTLDRGMEKADLIGEVEIMKKVTEVEPDKGMLYSVFQAKVHSKLIGNETSKEITIKQEGTSKVSVNNFEQFNPGEKFILFLVEATSSKADYWILGANTGLFQITDNGKVAKLFAPIVELQNLADQTSENVNKNQLKTKDAKDVQVINKQMFIDKILKLSKKGQ